MFSWRVLWIMRIIFPEILHLKKNLFIPFRFSNITLCCRNVNLFDKAKHYTATRASHPNTHVHTMIERCVCSCHGASNLRVPSFCPVTNIFQCRLSTAKLRSSAKSEENTRHKQNMWQH